MVGTEEILMPAMEAGADGSVCGGANMFPELFVNLYQAIIDDQKTRATAMQEQVVRISEALYSVGAPETSYFRGLKAALAELGVCRDTPAEPFAPIQRRGKRRVPFPIESIVARYYLKGSTMQTFRAALLAALTLFCSAALSFGQVNATGTFSGQVKDATGAAIPNAAVKVTEQETGIVTSKQSASDGYFTVAIAEAGNLLHRGQRPGILECGEKRYRAADSAGHTRRLHAAGGKYAATGNSGRRCAAAQH